MVTFEAIIAAVAGAALMVMYFVLKLIGYAVAIPVAVILVAWITDYVKGSTYTSSILGLVKSIIPQHKEKSVCVTCEPQNAETLPEDHVYCYTCGRQL